MTEEEQDKAFTQMLREYRQFTKNNAKILWSYELWQYLVANRVLAFQMNIDEAWLEHEPDFTDTIWGTITELAAEAGHDLDEEVE